MYASDSTLRITIRSIEPLTTRLGRRARVDDRLDQRDHVGAEQQARPGRAGGGRRPGAQPGGGDRRAGARRRRRAGRAPSRRRASVRGARPGVWLGTITTPAMAAPGDSASASGARPAVEREPHRADVAARGRGRPAPPARRRRCRRCAARARCRRAARRSRGGSGDACGGIGSSSAGRTTNAATATSSPGSGPEGPIERGAVLADRGARRR